MIKQNKRHLPPEVISNFSKTFFKQMYDSETTFYSNPSKLSFNNLLHLYKEGMDFYVKINDKYVNFLTVRMNSIINLYFGIEQSLKLLYLKKKIELKLKQMESPKENEILERKLKEESKKIIKKFNNDTNSNIILVKIYLREQRNNFIKRARDKIFKKFIKQNSNLDNDGPLCNKNCRNNLNITPIKNLSLDHEIIRQKIMIRTKGDSNMKKNFFPTQIFFDEDIYYLFNNMMKNNNNSSKERMHNVEKMTRNFITKYSLSYSSIIQEYIKKIIEIFRTNYDEKKNKYKQHCEAITFYDMIINDDYYKKDVIKNVIGLHEENIKYLSDIDDLQIEKNDKLAEIINRFKLNNPIDNKITNEIVNDYIYEIIEIFI